MIMATKKDVISKSKIKFLDPEKTSFTTTNTTEKTEFTYQKVQ